MEIIISPIKNQAGYLYENLTASQNKGSISPTRRDLLLSNIVLM